MGYIGEWNPTDILSHAEHGNKMGSVSACITPYG